MGVVRVMVSMGVGCDCLRSFYACNIPVHPVILWVKPCNFFSFVPVHTYIYGCYFYSVDYAAPQPVRPCVSDVASI